MEENDPPSAFDVRLLPPLSSSSSSSNNILSWPGPNGVKRVRSFVPPRTPPLFQKTFVGWLGCLFRTSFSFTSIERTFDGTNDWFMIGTRGLRILQEKRRKSSLKRAGQIQRRRTPLIVARNKLYYLARQLMPTTVVIMSRRLIVSSYSQPYIARN